MTREERIAEAARLYATVGNYREVGRRLGVNGATVQKWLKPEKAREWAHKSNAKRGPAKREWERLYDRHPCPRCGELMGVGAHRKGATVCRTCKETEWAEQRNLIADLDAQGLEPREIAAVMGITTPTVSTHLCRLRKLGLAQPRGIGQYTRSRAA